MQSEQGYVLTSPVTFPFATLSLLEYSTQTHRAFSERLVHRTLGRKVLLREL